MENITTVALSRMVAQTRMLDVIATNLANVNTPGFRAERTLFTAWLARQPGGAAAPGDGPISFAQDRSTYRDTEAGPRQVTGNPLDLAIGDPQGWFTVQTPRGPRLTRAGHFQIDAGGSVVDALGDPLLDANGRPLQTAPTDTRLTVAADGTLASQNGPIGRIGVVRPDDQQALAAEGGSLFATSAATAPVAKPELVQGTIEDSNVQPVLEVTRMMRELRDFQMTAQMIQAESDRQTGAIGKILNPSAQG